jgi:hypothetical protein
MTDEQFYQAFRRRPVGAMTPEEVARWERIISERVARAQAEEIALVRRGIIPPQAFNVIAANLRRRGIHPDAEIILAVLRAAQRERLPPTGPPTTGPPVIGPGRAFVYRRFIAGRRSETRRRGQLRYWEITVRSTVPLSGLALEEAFAREIRDFRRYIHYPGALWFATQEEAGRTVANYSPFPGELEAAAEASYEYDYDFYFDVPEDVYEVGYVDCP